jgi:cytochrome c6
MRKIIEGWPLIGSSAALLLLAVAVQLNGLALPGWSQKAPDAGALFAKNCASCHGRDGSSKTFKAKFNHARNLTDSEWQTTVSDERLFNSITNGRGHMPAWGKKLSEEEINSLVSFVRRLKKK